MVQVSKAQNQIMHHQTGRCTIESLILSLLLLAGCQTTQTPPRYQSQETFLQILSEFKRHQHLDLYRFPPPKDLSGQNVFKSTLVRLANYRKLYPDKYSDLIDFISAEAYERLGEYSAARSHYLKAADRTELNIARQQQNQESNAPVPEEFQNRFKRFETLKSTVMERLEILEPFIQISEKPLGEAETLEALIQKLEDHATDWKLLASSIPNEYAAYIGLAQVEWERAEARVAGTLWQNRLLLENGSNRAIERQKQIIENHPNSRLHDEHILTLGRWYETLAREYVREFPPGRAAFSREFFDQLVALSRRQFQKVEKNYGSRYREEARAHLLVLDAFVHRIHESL